MPFTKYSYPMVRGEKAAADGRLRCLSFGPNTAFDTVINGEDILISCEASTGYHIRRRTSYSFHSEPTTLGRMYVNEPGARAHLVCTAPSGALGIQLVLGVKALEECALEELDTVKSFADIRSLDCQTDFAILALIARAMTSQGSQTEYYIRSTIVRMLQRAGSNVGNSRHRISPSAMRRVRELDMNGGPDVDVPTMAREARMSLYHFSRCFKDEVGLTPWDYAARHRLWRMVEHMTTLGDAPMAVIAEKAGYHDKSHLARAIKAGFGCTFNELKRILP